MRLHLVAGKPTDSVSHGVLPAASRLGLDVVVLTDKPELHEQANGHPPTDVVRCDVHDLRALIATIATLPAPDGVFSNSDHLQAQTALAADYFGLPGKDWRSALRAKNKALMRRRLAETNGGPVAAIELPPGAEPPDGLPYPLVVKPRDGVASEDVVLVRDRAELITRCTEIRSRRPAQTLLAEEYLHGELHTLETLSDGVTTWVLGGFHTRLSPPPFFVEEQLSWDHTVPARVRRHVEDALATLGSGFGACHTEFAWPFRGVPRIIEVNDRLIGDHCDFLLADLFQTPIFEQVLRIYLGEPLAASPPQACGHAVADYVVADMSGILTAAPPPTEFAADDGVRLTYWPMRKVGDRIEVTRTNRDYLGVIRAVGSARGAVESAVRTFRDRNDWQITS
jgi:biotin carboxylase